MGHQEQIRTERELGATLEKFIKKLFEESKYVKSTFDSSIDKV
jgi:hypothetical protein